MDLAALNEIQRKVSLLVNETDDFRDLQIPWSGEEGKDKGSILIGGADVSFFKEDPQRGVGALCVLEFPSLR